MPDQTTIKSNTEPTIPTSSGNKNQSVSIKPSLVVSLCAAGLFICFFLPWLNSYLGAPSGFQFAKDGKLYFFWSLPIFNSLTIIAGLAKRGQKICALITGVIPFFILGYGLSQIGKDLLRILGVGAYTGLVLGLVMFIVGCRMKWRPI